MDRSHGDFETRNALDLKRVGLHRYVQHPSMGVWCMAWRLTSTGSKFLWRPGEADPVALLNHVYAGGLFVAHNAPFEFQVWNEYICKFVCPHWPRLKIEQLSCTMARANALGLPGDLDTLAVALRLADRKDKEGKRLMLQMARPRKVNEDGTYLWWDDADRQRRLGYYCLQDVEVETAADEMLPDLTPRERTIWELDHKINCRGVALDEPMIHRLLGVVDVAKKDLDAQISDLTSGAIKTCNQAKALVAWITDQGVPCVSVAAENHADILAGADALEDEEDELVVDVPVGSLIRRVLEVRNMAAKASTAKLKRMLVTLCADRRSRGLLAYHVTVQGRWAGRLWQPQNVKTREDEEVTDAALAMYLAEHIADPKALADIFTMLFRAPMEMVSLCLRSLIVAGPGNKLIGGDLSNIEGRGNAWLSGETWKIAAFHEYDRGSGPDLYRVAYASSFGVPVELVKGAMRQVGKVQELSLGYQGSVGAYVKMAKKKGINLARVRDTVKGATDEDLWSIACRAYDSARNKSGLDRETWAAVSIVVKKWRETNEMIVQGWWDLQDAAIEAVCNSLREVPVFTGKIRYLYARGFLWCALPSGRCIAYYRPEVRIVKEEWVVWPDGIRKSADDMFAEEIQIACERDGVQLHTREKKVVFYECKDDKGRWGKGALYGGMQCAHVVSGIARDILADAMLEAERVGMPIVLTVHDDITAEVPLNSPFGKADLEAILSRKPAWIEGDYPLSAKTWEGTRNAK
jgi:DNA polymerase